MVDAAGKAVTPGKDIPPIDRPGAAHGVEGGGDQDIVVVAPDVLLGFGREGRQDLRVAGADPLDPGLRTAGRGKDFGDLAQHVPAHFLAAVAFRLDHADQPGLPVIVDGGEGDATLLLRLGGALAQARRDLPGAGDDLRARDLRARDLGPGAALGGFGGHGARRLNPRHGRRNSVRYGLLSVFKVIAHFETSSIFFDFRRAEAKSEPVRQKDQSLGARVQVLSSRLSSPSAKEMERRKHPSLRCQGVTVITLWRALM